MVPPFQESSIFPHFSSSNSKKSFSEGMIDPSNFLSKYYFADLFVKFFGEIIAFAPILYRSLGRGALERK